MISRGSARFAIVVAVTAASLMTGCSKNPDPTPEPARERTEPPRMLTRGTFPQLSISGPNPAGRPVVRMRLEVQIDPLGRPDMETLKITGIAGPENRLAIERWLESASFRPAMQNGEPVRGVYELSLEARVTVRSY